MPKSVKKTKVDAAPVVPVAVPEEVIAGPVEESPKIENPNVKIVELNGRKYIQTFDPAEGTTSLKLLIE